MFYICVDTERTVALLKAKPRHSPTAQVMNISFVGKRALVTGAGRGTREYLLLMPL